MEDPMSASTPPRTSPLVGRVKAILLSPRSEWPVIAEESATTSSIYTGYVLPLAAIPAICGAIGLLGFAGSLYGGAGFSPMWAVRFAVSLYVESLIVIFLMSLVIDALAPTFGGQKNQVQALKVAAYSATASWIAGVFALIPALGILRLVGLYSLYLLYLGLPVVMKTPADRALAYTIATIVALFVIFVVIGAVAGRLVGLPRMY
jgi:hypothetical protein